MALSPTPLLCIRCCVSDAEVDLQLWIDDSYPATSTYLGSMALQMWTLIVALPVADLIRVWRARDTRLVDLAHFKVRSGVLVVEFELTRSHFIG